MRKITFGMTVSLDGYVETPDGDLSWGDPRRDLMAHQIEEEETNDTHLYGRRLYELMNAYWPTADQDPGANDQVIAYARLWKQHKTVVFSRTLTQVSGNAELFHGDLVTWVAQQKRLPGKNLNLGGPNLAASFMAHNLIDEYRVYIRPIILGGGKPMFPPLKEMLNLQLVETRRFEGDVVMLRLAPKRPA